MLQEAKTKMKRMVLLILVLFLLVDLIEDGCLGKANFCLPNPSAKTFVTSFPESESGHTDFRYEFASTNLPESFRRSDTRTVTLYVPNTLQITHYYHLSSSGGISL